MRQDLAFDEIGHLFCHVGVRDRDQRLEGSQAWISTVGDGVF
jgi:hypothetical protein